MRLLAVLCIIVVQCYLLRDIFLLLLLQIPVIINIIIFFNERVGQSTKAA